MFRVTILNPTVEDNMIYFDTVKELYAYTDTLEFPYRAEYENGNNWDNLRKTVFDLNQPAYTFVQNEDDVQAIREHVGIEENFRYYIVKEKDGDYIEVWGCDSPALDDYVTRVK